MNNINIPSKLSSIEKLTHGLVAQPEPLLGAETVQIILAREVHDYTVLRTEPTREINTTVTPTSIKDMTPILRVVFLASKQKAVETRAFRSILKSAKGDAGIQDDECYLKDGLCMECSRCILFGGVKTTGGQEAIKHRISYGSAFSLMPYEDIEMAFTFNAVDEKTQRTGQALGTRYSISPATIFPCIVSLRSITWRELIIVMKTLLATTNYGAEGRIGGQVRNVPLAIIAGWEEVITPLELCLELHQKFTKNGNLKVWDGNGKSDVVEVLQNYKEEAVFKEKVQIVADGEIEKLTKEIKEFPLDKKFLEDLDKDAKDFKEKRS